MTTTTLVTAGMSVLCCISVHDYNYTRDSWNVSVYAVPRFASEFGLLSWCSLETLATVSLPAVDWNLHSSFVSHRQHHPHGLLFFTLSVLCASSQGDCWWSELITVVCCTFFCFLLSEVHNVSASGQC